MNVLVFTYSYSMKLMSIRRPIVFCPEKIVMGADMTKRRIKVVKDGDI